MKFLITMFLVFNATAGLPPTTLSGQGSSTKPTTFNFKTPYNQATSTSLGGLIETGNQNMLVNGDFEALLQVGWTSSGGTMSDTVVASEVSSGIQAVKVFLSNPSK